jgi:hypothetical protein
MTFNYSYTFTSEKVWDAKVSRITVMALLQLSVFCIHLIFVPMMALVKS